MTAVPVLLTPLGHSRYALIAKETEDRAAHAAAGAVSVAYLQKEGRAWRVLGVWPQIAWAGQSGGGNLTVSIRRDLGATPFLFVNGFHDGQGRREGSSVVIRLGERPLPLGRIPADGDNFGNIDFGKDRAIYQYQSRVRPTRPPGVFAVDYEGRLGASGQAPRKEFRQSATFVLRNGCLQTTTTVRLPDDPWEWTTANCAAASAPGSRPAGTSARTGPGPGVTG